MSASCKSFPLANPFQSLGALQPKCYCVPMHVCVSVCTCAPALSFCFFVCASARVSLYFLASGPHTPPGCMCVGHPLWWMRAMMQTRGTLGSRTKERKPQAFASRLNPSLAPPSPLLSWTTSLLPQSPRYVLVYQKQLNTILATCPPPSSALFTHVPSHTHTHTHTLTPTHSLSRPLSLRACQGGAG